MLFSTDRIALLSNMLYELVKQYSMVSCFDHYIFFHWGEQG